MFINFSILFGSILKVSNSISAKIGMAFQTNIEVAEATILQGLVITSSPGSKPMAPNAHISPVVFEFTETLYLTLK